MKMLTDYLATVLLKLYENEKRKLRPKAGVRPRATPSWDMSMRTMIDARIRLHHTSSQNGLRGSMKMLRETVLS